MPKLIETDSWVKELRTQINQKTNNTFYIGNSRGRMRLEYNKKKDKPQTCVLPLDWNKNFIIDAVNLVVEIYNNFEYGKGSKSLHDSLIIAKPSLIKYKEGFTERELELIFYGLKEAVYKIETTAFGDEELIEENIADHYLLIGKVLKAKIKS